MDGGGRREAGGKGVDVGGEKGWMEKGEGVGKWEGEGAFCKFYDDCRRIQPPG